MTEAQKSEQTESKISTNTIVAASVAALVIVIAGIFVLTHFVNAEKKPMRGELSMSEEAIAARISPVANEGYNFKDASGGPKVAQTGEQVYTTVCSGCHNSGVAGSPKFGDAGAWAPRIAQGYDTLLTHAINGIRGMPARGGNADLSDIEVGRAIVHMVNASGAKFKEPEEKAEAAK
jgi:cytochrome c5